MTVTAITDDRAELATSSGAKIQVVGKASRGNQPYLRVESFDGDYLGCLDVDDMRTLRDALTAALRGWPT